MIRSWSLAGLVAGAWLVAVSCSDGEVVAPTTSSVATPSSVQLSPTEPPEPTAAPTTTTTVESTATAASTTAVESTAPPSTVSPTTTLPEGVPPRVTFPDDEEKQAVVDAAYAFFDAANSSAGSPSSDRLRSAFLETATEPISTRFIAFLDELEANGERVVGSPQTRLEIYEFTVAILGDGATFDACSIDDDVRVRTSSADDGGDLVVDGSVASWNQTYQLLPIDGRWRVSDIRRFATFEDQLGCGG